MNLPPGRLRGVIKKTGHSETMSSTKAAWVDDTGKERELDNFGEEKGVWI